MCMLPRAGVLAPLLVCLAAPGTGGPRATAPESKEVADAWKSSNGITLPKDVRRVAFAVC